MIYLMRHGQDDEKYVGGWSNIGLIEEGKESVKKTALWIKDNLEISQIISSDIARATETANIVKKIINISVKKTNKFREQNKGVLNGKLKSQLSDEEIKLLENQKIDTNFPQGESLVHLYNRIKKEMDYILNLKNNTLIITHRGVINMIYFYLLNKEPNMDKNQFNVTTSSIHELDQKNKTIRRIR